MKIDIIESQPVSESEIKQVEQRIGLRLTESYKAFILKYNGGIPKLNGNLCLLAIKHEDGYETENYIESLVSLGEVIEQWEFIGYLKELAEHFELTNEYVEVDKLFPVANLGRGVAYLALEGQHQGKIYTADNGDFGIIYHSPSWEKFLESLYSE